MALDLFSPAVSAWFEASFAAPSAAQEQGWPAIASGDHTLVLAPTGSGKTLAAFLWGIDRLVAPGPDGALPPERTGTSVVYVSPLRALAVDVEKNLRAPLVGIRAQAERLGVPFREPTVGLRTGDTPADVRRQLARNPPDILITTPESLYLMTTSQARESLRHVEAVIVDEIHSLVPTKRGAHLALTLERLEALTETAPQRIGLSATQRPLDVVARFLAGYTDAAPGGPGQSSGRRPRPVTIVDAGVRKALDVEVVVPVDDMGDLGRVIEEPVSGPAAAGPVRRSIWPSIHPRLLELVESHRSTLIFVNARRLAERLATRLNELRLEGMEGEARGGENDGTSVPEGEHELVKAHHGSLSRERRVQIEDELKSGRLRGLVATSSLELGIDMGAVDLVVQVESPGAVSRGLQRIGRAGHRLGEPSRGKVFPKHRHDLLEAAVVVQRMTDGLIESTRYPRNPLDVLAQQIVAIVALEDWVVDDLAALVRRAAPFAELSDEVFEAVLDLLSGRYPSEEFAELRPRVVWDRVEGVVRARSGAQRLAVTNAGTIPDRGLFGVFLPDGTRVGELDEEMVYESRVGETFLLGATTWRINEITHERVVVTPAPGQPGKMPFWRGDGPGRPLELGRALGAFVREVRDDPAAALDRLRTVHGLDERAAANVVSYLDEQGDATGAVPDDRTIVVERFRDEIGDWRVCILSPFGAQVHAPWGMAIKNRLADWWGTDVEIMWSDDGIVIRIPDTAEAPADDEGWWADEEPTGGGAPGGPARTGGSRPAADRGSVLEALTIDPDDVDELIVTELPNTAMFASRFRESAARALLLPRRRPDRRTPLWQQRQRAADLLQVASRYPSFPILLEATRECLNDVFDLPALREVLADIRARRVRVVEVETEHASPFAQSLLFGWIAVYMYEGDAPLAERRAAALALDRDLLNDLLGADELRELLDAGALADLELELQCLADGRRARDPDEAHDLLRRLGPLSLTELDARCEGDGAEAWAEQLEAERRAYRAVVGGAERLCAAEDAGRLRDALGVTVPIGLPSVFTEPVDAPLVGLVARFARTHGPFTAHQAAARYGSGHDRTAEALAALEAGERVVQGEFRPDGVEREWCDVDVLRQLRRRSLARLRHEVEPVDGATLARFLQQWHGIGSRRRGVDALADVISQLQGAPVPASVLESEVLPARLADFRGADLDALCTAGELVWVGAGSVGANDGRVRLVFRDRAALLVPGADEAAEAPDGPVHTALLDHLGARGASFWSDLAGAVARAGLPYDDPTVLAALWDLVWAGLVTNDSLAPLRAFVGGKVRKAAGRRRPAVGRLQRLGPPAGAGRWSLVAPLLDPRPSPTELAHARAAQLIERYGVLTREAALGEGVEGGFAGVYPVLKALEEKGRARRGYFVAGLGAAQFALPGAVDRLRAARSAAERSPTAPLDGPPSFAPAGPAVAPAAGRPSAGAGPGAGGARGGSPGRDGDGADGRPGSGQAAVDVVVLAATDPAQPYGAALPWPESGGRPARAAGALVVLADGEPVAFVERGGRSLWTFPAAGSYPDWPHALGARVGNGRVRSHEVATIDGEPVRTTRWAEPFRRAGFADGYRGLVARGR
ncbi:MAG TPA: DEAD/DEAH box helicase [Acidimicrobiales bacterium]|nr:DEAD/DEAH box helicase [Acidimicrobiales bacterium]